MQIELSMHLSKDNTPIWTYVSCSQEAQPELEREVKQLMQTFVTDLEEICSKAARGNTQTS